VTTFCAAGGERCFWNNPGSDTYIFGRGDGVDRITESIVDPLDRNIISFVDDIRPDQLWFRRVANDMEVSIIGTADKINISGWFTAERVGIQEFRTAGGYVLTEKGPII